MLERLGLGFFMGGLDRYGLLGRRLLLTLLLLNSTLLGGCSFLLPRGTVKFILYTVQRGDTLDGVSRRFSVTVKELQAVNEIDDPRALVIGQFMRIPYHGQSLKRLPGDKGGVIHNMQKPASREAIRTVRLSSAARFVGKLSWPVQSGGRISSPFGRRWTSFHEGIDIGGEEGSSILAAHDGVIVYSSDGLRGYGNLIVLKGNGLVTVYGHNRKNLARPGQVVRRGQEIALLGMSGHASGPHLHFETRVKDDNDKNVAVDPLAFFP